MKQVTHNVEDTMSDAPKTGMKLIVFETKTVTERVDKVARENARRATEIGPVLEDILQNKWGHWGLND
jgi:hypothetical protein